MNFLVFIIFKNVVGLSLKIRMNLFLIKKKFLNLKTILKLFQISHRLLNTLQKHSNFMIQKFQLGLIEFFLNLTIKTINFMIIVHYHCMRQIIFQFFCSVKLLMKNN